MSSRGSSQVAIVLSADSYSSVSRMCLWMSTASTSLSSLSLCTAGFCCFQASLSASYAASILAKIDRQMWAFSWGSKSLRFFFPRFFILWSISFRSASSSSASSACGSALTSRSPSPSSPELAKRSSCSIKAWSAAVASPSSSSSLSAKRSAAEAPPFSLTAPSLVARWAFTCRAVSLPFCSFCFFFCCFAFPSRFFSRVVVVFPAMATSATSISSSSELSANMALKSSSLFSLPSSSSCSRAFEVVFSSASVEVVSFS
mmetsp:Transcript_821/g.2530  ORF Transcript_821/g.2530 Transcript_821/m.2530 type:complete len:259 (-) Transcript_821:169-945(-)